MKPIAFALALTAFACTPAQSPTEGDLVMRAYDVPQPYGPEIAGTLRTLLWRGKESPMVGQVETSPSGQILVAAPRGFHAGVQQFLVGLKKAEPTPPPAIQIDYSIVLGRPSGEAQPAPGDGYGAAALGVVHELHPTLELRLLEQVRVTSLSGEHAMARGAQVDVSHNATLYGDKVLAKLEINPKGPNAFETHLEVPLEKTLVLGQSGFVNASPNDPFTGKRVQGPPSYDAVVFYVIRANVHGK
jgi:hypothetical protein